MRLQDGFRFNTRIWSEKMQHEAINKPELPMDWKKKALYIGLLIGYSIVLFLLSTITGQELPGALFENQDKLEHLMAYGFMAFVAWIAMRQLTSWRHPWLWAWVYAVGYGVTDEWHQLFVPGRYADLLDLLADATGAALAILILEYHRSRRAARPIPVLTPPVRYSVF
ncbi:hypothetical protein SIID45300_00721 [Candidatus Magnetaquicoccaceae bacterium FCR-1]|uniref:VanZ-like domain-containing protein n=2 Tax=Candidatus Magnetaquiglobus chichijimensis TaxID=3141448 RepID=A0ABQ0C6A2_9PROT